MSGTAADQYNLIWRNHQLDLLSSLKLTLFNQNLVDCTLVAEDGRCVKAHRVILAASSPYFERILSGSINYQDKHPFFIMKDVDFEDLRALLDYIYKGETLIPSTQIKSFMKAAENLRVKGLVREESNIKDEGESINIDDCDEQSSVVFEEQTRPKRSVRNSTQTSTVVASILEDEVESSSNEVRITRGNSISSRRASRNDKNPNPPDEIQHNPIFICQGTSGLVISNQTDIEEKSEVNETGIVSTGNRLNISLEIPPHKRRITNRSKRSAVQKMKKSKKVKSMATDRFVCSNCEKSYRALGNLKRHKTYECGKAPSFKCDACSKQFKRKESLKLHRESLSHKAEVAKI